MSLLKMVNSIRLLGRQKLVQVFIFWFEEDVLSLCNNFKNIWNQSNQVKKNNHNLNNIVKGILWLYNKIPDKKAEGPTEILVWKVSLTIIYGNAVDKLIVQSIWRV